MLQMRMPGGDPRWFNIERDMAYALPRILMRTMKKFDEQQASGRVFTEDESKAFARLGKLIADMVACKVDEAEAIKALKEMDSPFIRELLFVMCTVLFSEFRVWTGQVKIKGQDASAIDISELEKLTDRVLNGIICSK